MSVLRTDSRRMSRRWLPVAQLAALGAGLVVAALHGGTGPANPASMTAATYQPPPVAPVTAPAGEVHTMSGPSAVSAAKRAPAPRRAVPPVRASARPAPEPAVAGTVRAAGPSFQQSLDAAIARIPTYRAGAARWIVSRAYDFWGTADWYHDVLYVSPDVPVAKLYDVAVHEWSHELSVLDYGGDVAAATAAMNAWFGGSDLTGPERAADCMAILQGARWTHYTTCGSAQWRLGAARLIAGQHL